MDSFRQQEKIARAFERQMKQYCAEVKFIIEREEKMAYDMAEIRFKYNL